MTHKALWASKVVLVLKNLLANAGGIRHAGSIPGLGRSPGEGNSNPLQYSCLEKSHGQRSLVGYSPWGGKESAMTERLTLFTFTKALYRASLVAQMVKRLPEMWETQVRFLGREDALEKEMAIHSNTLAWKIPWTEEPDRLQSMGSQRVRHHWVTSLSLSKPFIIWSSVTGLTLSFAIPLYISCYSQLELLRYFYFFLFMDLCKRGPPSQASSLSLFCSSLLCEGEDE